MTRELDVDQDLEELWAEVKDDWHNRLGGELYLEEFRPRLLEAMAALAAIKIMEQAIGKHGRAIQDTILVQQLKLTVGRLDQVLATTVVQDEEVNLEVDP